MCFPTTAVTYFLTEVSFDIVSGQVTVEWDRFEVPSLRLKLEVGTLGAAAVGQGLPDGEHVSIVLATCGTPFRVY